MKLDIVEAKKIIKEYIFENYNYLFIKIESNFIGCKYNEKDFFIFFVSIYNDKLTLTYRENYKEKDVIRINIEEFNKKQIEDYIDSVMSKTHNIKNIQNSSCIISSSINNRIKDKRDVNDYVLKLKLKKYKLSSLNISDKQRIICESNNINNLYDLLISNQNELREIKEYYYIHSYSSFINRYLKELSIKPLSTNKIDIDYIININDEDYEKYTDFGIKLGEIINDFLIEKNSPRNSEIFKYRYGLIDNDNHTLEDIGNKYNISRERVRQIINKSVRKLSHPASKKVYLSQIISLINEIDNKEIIKYYIYGVINIYNKRFLEFLLNLINKKYCNQVFEYIEEIAYILSLETVNEKYVKKYTELIKLIKFPITTVDNSKIFATLTKQRDVNPENNIGTIHLVKQNKDVEYESFSEKKILELLSHCPFILDIKVQSLKIKYNVNNNEWLYYPDFQILFDDGRMAIIEVKDSFSMGDYIVKSKYNALKEFCEENGIGYMMIDDRMHDFETIKETKYNEKDKKLLMDHLINNRRMNYTDFLEYKNEINFNNIDFLSMIINEDNIIFHRSPFYIKLKQENIK